MNDPRLPQIVFSIFFHVGDMIFLIQHFPAQSSDWLFPQTLATDPRLEVH